jgi:hypothetical protein
MTTIQRDSGYADKFRKYKIIVDNKVAGEVADGESKTLDLKDGTHTIYCKYSLYKTHAIDFEENGQVTNNFHCINKVRGARIYLIAFYAFAFLFRGSYIELSSSNE